MHYWFLTPFHSEGNYGSERYKPLLRPRSREPDNLRQALQNYDRFLRDIGLIADVVASRVESVLRGENVSDFKRREA